MGLLFFGLTQWEPEWRIIKISKLTAEDLLIGVGSMCVLGIIWAICTPAWVAWCFSNEYASWMRFIYRTGMMTILLFAIYWLYRGIFW